MKSSLYVVAALLPLLSATASGPQTEESLNTAVTIPVGYRYLLSKPEGYDQDQTKKWPLLVFLHGAGERGDKLDALKRHGPPKLIEDGKKFPAIVASPQCPSGRVWNPHGIQKLVDELSSTHRVDPRRIYLTGLSMGGFGTWETATEYPETFAAIIPICGGGGIRILALERVKHLPQWIFHGAKDNVVPAKFSQDMFNALKKLGAPVQLEIYPNADHDSWTATYANDAVWEWLFAQQKK